MTEATYKFSPTWLFSRAAYFPLSLDFVLGCHLMSFVLIALQK